MMVEALGAFIMDTSSHFIIYILETCPNCEILKEHLDAEGAAYRTRDMMSAEALTELRINGVFVREAPVLQKEGTFLTSADLFSGGVLNRNLISSLIKGD